MGQTVDEAAWLFVAMEHSCRDQLAVEAAVNGNPNVTKALIDDEQARVNFELEADPDFCYAEFQVYYNYEHHMSNVDFIYKELEWRLQLGKQMQRTEGFAGCIAGYLPGGWTIFCDNGLLECVGKRWVVESQACGL